MTPILPILAALSIVSPRDGATVPTQKDAQKDFFSGTRAERAFRMDNLADRAKLAAVGSTQQPLKLAWTMDETNAICVLKVVREGGALEVFTVTNRTTVYLTNLELGARYHWSVFDGRDTAASSFVTEADAPRFLRAEGVGNFRDLGGWRTTDGRRVRENRIFRSAGLRASSKSRGNGLFSTKIVPGVRRVTDAGLATLRNDFGIRTDLELRTPQETAGMGTTLLGPGVKWVNESFAAYDFIDSPSRGKGPFGRIFRLFSDDRNYPVLMHCSGGRDRTGTLAFLLNGLLGVSEDDLCRDWEATVFADGGATFTSDRLQRLLDYLKTYPGDTLQARIEVYAKSCGVTDAEIAAFRRLMLEDPQPRVIVAHPTASPDVLEPSVRNEVDHARARVPAGSANAWSAAAEDFVRQYETNDLNATDAAIRLVSAQRPDGRWLAGTNDVTAAAVRILDRLSGDAR